MPQYYAGGLGELIKATKEEQEAKSPDFSKALGQIVGGYKQFKESKTKEQEQKQSTQKDFFNTYASLRQQGFNQERALDTAKEMTGYKGKDFVSEGFEQEQKRKLGLLREKEELGLEKARLGVEKLRGEVGKLNKEIKGIEKGGQYTKEQLSSATTLRKEFDSNKAVKQYNMLNRSVSGLRQALDLSMDTKSRIASDQALGVMFQKMLDPDSVVRESEYSRTPEGASVINRVKSYLPKLQKGGLALTNEDRQAIVEMGEKLLESGIDTYNQQYDRYENLATSYGTDPKLIFGETLKKIEKPSEIIEKETIKAQEFGTMEEAEEAERQGVIKKGDIIIIQGRRARVQ